MKLVAALCLVAVVGAAPPTVRVNHYSKDNVQLLRFDNENPGEGNFRFAYEQSDGTQQEQQGELRNEGTDEELSTIRGSFTWIGPDNVTYKVTFVADENGYQPVIEQGPGGAIPPAVIASLLG